METVIAIRIEERRKKAQEVQKLLTGFSGIIETRLGLKREDGGVIILDVNGVEKAVREFKKKLRKVEGVQLEELSFD